MVASSDPCWLQGAFNTLVGLFDRVGLRKNVRNTVGMVCHPGQAAGNLSTEAYGWRVRGGGTYIQGAAQRTSGVRRVRRAVGGRIPVDSSDDSKQEGGSDTAAMEHTGRGDQTPDLQDVLHGEGRTAEMPSDGVPKHSGDKDGNAGALLAPACPRHCGELPPPTVRPVRHSSPPAGVERAAPGHSIVKKGGRTEETTSGGGGYAGEYGAGL